MAGDTANGSDTLLPFSEPSDFESVRYFRGLAGGRLIVRSNCHEQPWSRIQHMTESYFEGMDPMIPREKTFVGIGHISRSRYRECRDRDIEAMNKLRELYPRIVDILEHAQIEWVWFVGVRIGYRDAVKVDDFPIVLYLNVKVNTAFERVEPVARNIRGLLKVSGLHRIHVEARENVLAPGATDPVKDFQNARNSIWLGDQDLAWSVLEHDTKKPYCSHTFSHTLGEIERIKAYRRLEAHNHWLHLNGTYLQKSDMITGVPIVRVFKRGRTSGITAGVTNGIEAVVRRVPGSKAGQSTAVWKILVLPWLEDHGEPRQKLEWDLHEPLCDVFSVPGDSGAAVLDLDGRYIGQVVGGGATDKEAAKRLQGIFCRQESIWQVGKQFEICPKTLRWEIYFWLRDEAFVRGEKASFVTPAWSLSSDIKQETGIEPYTISSKI